MQHPTEEMINELEKKISFTVEELPEILEWKTGERYTIELEVIQHSRIESEYEDTFAVFRIKKVSAVESPVAGQGVALGGPVGGQE